VPRILWAVEFGILGPVYNCVQTGPTGARRQRSNWAMEPIVPRCRYLPEFGIFAPSMQIGSTPTGRARIDSAAV